MAKIQLELSSEVEDILKRLALPVNKKEACLLIIEHWATAIGDQLVLQAESKTQGAKRQGWLMGRLTDTTPIPLTPVTAQVTTPVTAQVTTAVSAPVSTEEPYQPWEPPPSPISEVKPKTQKKKPKSDPNAGLLPGDFWDAGMIHTKFRSPDDGHTYIGVRPENLYPEKYKIPQDWNSGVELETWGDTGVLTRACVDSLVNLIYDNPEKYDSQEFMALVILLEGVLDGMPS